MFIIEYMNKKLFASLMLVLASMFWGLAYSVQSISSDTLGPYTIVFFKGAGGILLLIYALIKKEKTDKRTIFGSIMCGIVAGSGLTLQQKGIEVSTVSKASFITSLYIVFVPILGIFYKKTPKLKAWISVLIAAVGIYFLCGSSNFNFTAGDTYTLLGAICFAMQIMLIDKYSTAENSLMFSAISQTIISLVAGIMMIVFEKPTLADIGSCIIPVLYSLFIAGLYAQILQNKYQGEVDPTLASLLLSCESIFGTLFGWLILKQTLTLKEIFGCVLMLIAMFIAQ